ncbi:MAG TPA: LuxR C-terminal-related transcriptional regulator [Chloroflexota bacterium]
MGGLDRAPRFGDLFDRSSDAVFTVGPGFRIVWWGSRAEQMLGLPAARALGRRCFDLFAGSEAMGQQICEPGCWVAQALRDGQTVPAFCMRLSVTGGEPRTCSLGFLVDRSGEFLVHILRELQPATLAEAQPLPTRAHARRTETANLTARQREVLGLIVAGATSREIAQTLCVTHATARNHVQNLLVKLGVHRRLEAALLASREQDPEP